MAGAEVRTYVGAGPVGVRCTGGVPGRTWGMRWRKASPLSVPTASATRKLSRKLKNTLFMRGMRTTPSRDSRLMTVMDTKPPAHAAHTHTHTDLASGFTSNFS